MPDRVRLGLIGASVAGTWSARSHLPAVRASPDIELTAVCTTKAATAEAARQMYGARLAFDDYRAMIASPEIDAVAVVVRVPSHYGPTRAALEAGKHVYCEWPLGRTTAEATELSALAQANRLVSVVGLQARVHPTLMYMKELIDAGFAGPVMAVHVSLLRDGVLTRPSPHLAARCHTGRQYADHRKRPRAGCHAIRRRRHGKVLRGCGDAGQAMARHRHQHAA
jgi:predicted dehydrogenase